MAIPHAASITLPALREHVARRLAVASLPQALIRAPALPRTDGTGKLQRAAYAVSIGLPMITGFLLHTFDISDGGRLTSTATQPATTEVEGRRASHLPALDPVVSMKERSSSPLRPRSASDPPLRIRARSSRRSRSMVTTLVAVRNFVSDITGMQANDIDQVGALSGLREG